jgi:hypothetical protein
MRKVRGASGVLSSTRGARGEFVTEDGHDASSECDDESRAQFEFKSMNFSQPGEQDVSRSVQ